jgi:hypothetical protein
VIARSEAMQATRVVFFLILDESKITPVAPELLRPAALRLRFLAMTANLLFTKQYFLS